MRCLLVRTARTPEPGCAAVGGRRLRAAPAPRTRPRTVGRRAGPGEEPPPPSVIPVGYALPRVVWTASSLASSVTAPWVAQAWWGAGDRGCPPPSTPWPACDPPTAPAPGVESLCVLGPHDSGSCYTRSAQPYKPAVPGPGSFKGGMSSLGTYTGAPGAHGWQGSAPRGASSTGPASPLRPQLALLLILTLTQGCFSTGF